MKTFALPRHSGLLILAALAALAVWTLLSVSPPLVQAKTPTAQAGKKQKTPAKPKPAKPAQSKPAKPAEPLPWPQNVTTLAGDGAVLVVDQHAPPGQPRELYAYNAEKPYVPASILKIVTSGAALEFLGPNFHFKTDFLLTKSNDLWVVGYGDPYLVSEELALIVKELQKRGLKTVRNIIIDNSYFQKDLVLDGNTQTLSPFDAYNGAFSANFNTVAFQRDKKGQVSRAAAHIPLTPLALKMAAQTKGPGIFTFNISESPQAAELNSGEILKAHLKEAGLPVEGEIVTGRTAPARRKIFYRHESVLSLDMLLKLLMEHSNNFMTNQIFLALGAELYGPPASLEKSQAAMNDFFLRHALEPIAMGDGSGLSRQTTLTARQMADVLAVVEPDRHVFARSDDGLVLSKTGTMSDIKTLAGYLERQDEPDRPLSFVILLNGPGYHGGTRDQILTILKNKFLSPPPAPVAGAPVADATAKLGGR